MTPDRFLEVMLEEGRVKTAAIRSKYEANVKLDKLSATDFPHAIVSQLLPSKEKRNPAGWFDSYYLISVLVVQPIEFTAEYPDKMAIKETLRSICRQIMINVNDELQRYGTDDISEFQITGLIDVKFDRNCIACEFIINLPHTDSTQQICN
jgi:hypothetical protein